MRWWSRAVPAVLLLTSLAMLATPRRARTLPVYAARTGFQCAQCHFDPNGGGPRNDFGFGFAKNRHSLAPEDSTSPWKDLALTNRIGDSFPLYVGLNHRFMAIANTTVNTDSLDRAGFFNMESAIHLTFQPHPRLTMVYTRDGFGGGSTTKDAFGMIGGFPLDGYLKAGRIRTPFGLRMDDHTVATRNGFLDFFAPTTFSFGYGDSVVAQFMPYDVRQPDVGIEYGMTWHDFFGRAALTDGDSDPLSPDGYAGAKTVKLGYNTPWYQAGFSFYDDFRRHSSPAFFPTPRRATRWAYYGILHRGPVGLLGEIAAGTDAYEPLSGVPQPRKNSLAGWAEVDWFPLRQWNFRVRYDHLSLDRGNADSYLRDLNTHTRYAVEADWVPVPFAELRWTLRRIDHKAEAFRDVFGFAVPIDDETQSYLQLHFSY